MENYLGSIFLKFKMKKSKSIVRKLTDLENMKMNCSLWYRRPRNNLML